MPEPLQSAVTQGKSPSWKDDAADALKFTQALREYHHKALWEEEKHFTWLHSIILAAQAAILTRTPDELAARSTILVVLGVIGLLFAIVAFCVVRREGQFFTYAHNLFVNRFNVLFPATPLLVTAVEPTSSVFLTPFRVLTGKASIRENFQFVFIVFGVVNAFLVVAVVTCAV
jgi:hypothetical protein